MLVVRFVSMVMVISHVASEQVMVAFDNGPIKRIFKDVNPGDSDKVFQEKINAVPLSECVKDVEDLTAHFQGKGAKVTEAQIVDYARVFQEVEKFPKEVASKELNEFKVAVIRNKMQALRYAVGPISVAAVVGCTVAILLAVILIAGLVIYYWKRKMKADQLGSGYYLYEEEEVEDVDKD